MKRIPFCLLGAMAAVLAGCVVTAVYPFYTEKDVAFEPAMLGQWTNSAETNQRWTFEKDGASSYRLTCVEGDKPSVMQAQPFKLGGQFFLDLSRTNSAEEPFPPPIPSHVLLRVVQTRPILRVAPLKYDWLKGVLEEDPKALRHLILKTGDNPEDRYFVLTADTGELQQFVIKHLKTDAAWKDVIELKRASLQSNADPKPR
ncbi:MAG TPA: hypothetical protein VEO53_02475 [Candidatus Binatia bacterium]|nr:hypothetical protein [Candidatus Binatia bacterium]